MKTKACIIKKLAANDAIRIMNDNKAGAMP